MIYYVDIDETICTYLDSESRDPNAPTNYAKAVPIFENIAKINALHDAGHAIVYWTARGVGTRTDWREVTERQLDLWGAKRHRLRLDKPAYHMLIDDKSMRIEEL